MRKTCLLTFLVVLLLSGVNFTTAEAQPQDGTQKWAFLIGARVFSSPAPPYTTDGGNLTLEFTIQAPDVKGAAQVFSSSFAFGTYPMQVIQ